MPRYSLEQQMKMSGKKVPAKPAAPKAEAAPKPAMEPKVKARVEALTKPAKEYKEHHGLISTVHDILQRGVNDFQGDIQPQTNRKGFKSLPESITKLYSMLHNASLHLNAHHSAHIKGHHMDAAAHLEKATDNLTRVANHLSSRGMPSAKDADGSEFPLHFVGQVAREANNHYRTSVANISGSSAVNPNKKYPVADTRELVEHDQSGGSAVKHGTAHIYPSRSMSNPLPSGRTHTLESSRYKGRAPMYPARIEGPERKG